VRQLLGMTPAPTSRARPKRRARPLPAYRPFPLDAPPGPARDYCAEVAAATGTDSAFCALPCLAAMGGLIGNTRRLQVKASWSEPPCVWALPVADSGAVKSPPAELAIQPVQDIAQEQFEDYQARDEAHQQELAGWEAAKKSERGPKPRPPIMQQVLVGVSTIEAMIELHADNPHGLLLYQ